MRISKQNMVMWRDLLTIFCLKNGSGNSLRCELHTAIISDSSQVANLIGLSVRSLGNVLCAGLSIIVALIWNPNYALLVFGLSLFMSLAYRHSTRFLKQTQRSLQEANRELSHFSIMLVGGLKTLKQSNVAGTWLQSLNTKIDNLQKNRKVDGKIPLNGKLATDVLFGISVTILFLLQGPTRVTEILVILGLFYRLIPKIQDAQQQLKYVKDCRFWVEDWMYRLEVLKPTSVVINSEEQSKQECSTETFSVNVAKVTFAYPDSGKIINEFDLKLEHGQLLLIHGKSGIGKSTISDLLTGIIQPSSGSIEICGRPISLDSNNNAIVVSSESEIFGRTINSILNWNIDGLYTEREVDFVKLTCGIDSMFLFESKDADAEAGSDLSSGMKSRLIIARALLAKPHVLVLDEITSRLDINSEFELIKNLQVNFPLLSLIVISHRNSLQEVANQSVYLNELHEKN